MGEELFTLLFILFIILASVLDAVGRRRKKERQMKEMEQEEARAVEEAAPGRTARSGTAVEEGTPRGASIGSADSAPESPADTMADTMVPEDLWAILTGQEPPSQQRRREAEAAGTARAEPSSEAPPREPHIPTPVPQDRISTRDQGGAPRQAQAQDPPTRRGELWMEGTRGRGESESWGASRREPSAIEAQEKAVYDAIEEPWDEFEDIAAGEIAEGGEEGEGARAPAHPSAYAKRGPARRRTRYTRLLESGSREDLKKAVVLREVLDRPVGFRDGVGPEGNW